MFPSQPQATQTVEPQHSQSLLQLYAQYEANNLGTQQSSTQPGNIAIDRQDSAMHLDDLLLF